MRLKDLIEDIESADASGHEVILWEEQYRGSPAAYSISGWDFKEVTDEDADYILEDCEACGGSGEVEDEDNEDEMRTCDECSGDGEIETGEQPTKTVLAIKIDHSGYAPGGLRD